MKKGVYCVHDNVSGDNGPPVFSVSDEAFVRDFGVSFVRLNVPDSMAIELTGIKLGDLEIPDNPHSLPRLVGYECPVPICSAAEAMSYYADFVSEKEDSIDG